MALATKWQPAYGKSCHRAGKHFTEMTNALLKPSEIFASNIQPAFRHYAAAPNDERLANILAAAIDNHAEWSFQYYSQNDPSRLSGATTPIKFRQKVFSACPSLRMMWDLNDANKHRFLTRPGVPRTVTSSTAAYSLRDNELWVNGYDEPFLLAVKDAAEFWEKWPD
jgi:hypothetical protein